MLSRPDIDCKKSYTTTQQNISYACQGVIGTSANKGIPIMSGINWDFCSDNSPCGKYILGMSQGANNKRFAGYHVESLL